MTLFFLSSDDGLGPFRSEAIRPKFRKYETWDDLGAYLAGIFEMGAKLAPAHGQIVLRTNPQHVRFLRYLRSILGGNVSVRKKPYKIRRPEQKALRRRARAKLKLTKSKEIANLARLIVPHIRLESTYKYLSRFKAVRKAKLDGFDKYVSVGRNGGSKAAPLLQSPYLAGWLDINGIFVFRVRSDRLPNKKIRRRFTIKCMLPSHSHTLVCRLKNEIGDGEVFGTRIWSKWVYSTEYLSPFIDLMFYLDRYPMQSEKHISYIAMRKAAMLVAKKGQFYPSGWASLYRLLNICYRYEMVGSFAESKDFLWRFILLSSQDLVLLATFFLLRQINLFLVVWV